MIALTWLGACADPPRATRVEPPEVWAGETLRVLGDGFDAATRVSLTRPDESVDLPITDVRSTTLLVEIPAAVSGGAWQVSLAVGEREPFPTGIPVGVRVDHPCAGDFRVNTRVSVAQQRVVLDRYFPDGARESLSLGFGEISRVEVERDPGCSAVFLRRAEGGRVLYSDDAKRDLGPRAAVLADWIGRPVVDASPRGFQ